MNGGNANKEPLFVKKIRYHHPMFSLLNYSSFKLIFDQSELLYIKKGEKLYKQDTRINQFYFVMYGLVRLRYRTDYK